MRSTLAMKLICCCGVLAAQLSVWLFLGFADETRRILPVAGWLETVRVYPANMLLTAKLDTGAKNSSIKADIVEILKREDGAWVRFTITNKKGKTVTLERPVVRTAKIKSRRGGYIERPVVLLGICLGNAFKKVEVNLAPRENFNYHLILGRSFLQNAFYVDVDRKFTTKPTCTDTFIP